MTDLFTMSNLSPAKTGLPFVVWISPRGYAQHDLRVKISKSSRVVPGEFITVAVRPAIRIVHGRMSAVDFSLLKAWIELNQNALIAFWNGDIEYTEDVLKELKSI